MTKKLKWSEELCEQKIAGGFNPMNLKKEPQAPTTRTKLPHGWLVSNAMWNAEGIGSTFVPFAEDGTGWGPNDDLDLPDDDLELPDD